MTVQELVDMARAELAAKSAPPSLDAVYASTNAQIAAQRAAQQAERDAVQAKVSEHQVKHFAQGGRGDLASVYAEKNARR